MIAVDTNLLVYSHREDHEWHEPAWEAVRGLAEGRASWAVPWPCIHEFYAIATHPRIFDPPTPRPSAIDQIEAWLESPRLVLLAEDDGYFDTLKQLLAAGRVTGPRVHDARIAALCLRHGVRELWTAGRDFGAFPALATRNPLAE